MPRMRKPEALPATVRFMGPAKLLKVRGPSGTEYAFERYAEQAVEPVDYAWVFELLPRARFESVQEPAPPPLDEVMIEPDSAAASEA